MPKIKSIEATGYEFSMPAERGYGTARGFNTRRQSTLVAVTTDEGVVGYSEALGAVIDGSTSHASCSALANRCRLRAYGGMAGSPSVLNGPR